jgi:hypothetical protein
MIKFIRPFILTAFLASSYIGQGQIAINEVQISNLSTIMDEDGEYNDWLEIYNAGNTTVDLTGFRLNDNSGLDGGWSFGDMTIGPNSHHLVYLSGKNRQGTPGLYDHYEIAVFPAMTWSYLVPTGQPTSDWNTIGFDDSSWQQGIGGIGYADGDDNTIISQPAYSVYSRTTFELSNPSAVTLFILAVDYDDAFVAYLNGVEIGRSNIGTVGVPPNFDTPAAEEHEANEYQGLEIENWVVNIALIQSLLVDGENVFSLQVHNTDANSSDLTGNPYVVLGMATAELQTNPAPADWDTGETADHTDFGLSGGETLYLYDAENVLIDSLITQPMQPDFAIRRSTDGAASWCYTDEPTPDAINTGSCYSGVEQHPLFNLESGLYNQGVYLTLTSPNPNAIIRFSTDGSKPNENSAIYTSPLAIGASTVIAARCFSNTSLPSPVKKNTYLIDENDIEIPVISVSIDPADLWDPVTGLHVFGPPDYDPNVPYWGANFWENWEREGYVEYFDADHIKQMEGPIGLKIHGGWSRVNEQKSLRIQAKGKYGMEEMNYPLIQDKPYLQSYKGFNLRNGGNAYWDYRFHEALIERTCRNTHNDYMSYTPVIVFLNGEYWGFMEVRENLDQHFVATNHDISSNDVSVISANYFGFNVISGSDQSFYDLTDYATTNSPTGADYFNTISAQLDIENYADYIIAQTYWGNGDWSNGYQNNTKLWHDDRPGGKWRFMLMDMDFGMGLAGASPTDNYIAQAGGDWFATDLLYDAVIQNPTFRTYFINRYADLINTEFQSTKIISMAMAMKAEVEPIFQRHAQRWGTDGGALEGTLNWRLDWSAQRVQGARDVVQSHFNLPDQVNITLETQPQGAGRIQISTIQPDLSNGPWEGVYFNGVPVVVKAYANPGYTFDHWLANEVFNSNNPNQTFEMMFGEDIHFTAVFEGVPVNHPLAITEMMFNADSQNSGGDWIELHNNTNADIDLSQWKIKDSNYFNTYTFPEGSTLAANSQLVVATNLEEFVSQYPEVTNVIGSLGFSLSNSDDAVHLLRPSGQAYISYNYSDDDSIELLCSDGCGYSRRHASTISGYDPALWTLGCLNGTPGEFNVTCNDLPYISEINYNASATDDSGDWIEFHNPSGESIDLSGWFLRDANDNTFVIPNGTNVLPNARLVLVTDPALFNSVYPTITNTVGPTQIAFANGGDAIKLYDANNTLVYSMKYDDQTPWPYEPDGLGKTLEYTGTGGNNCSPMSWIQGCPLGSPDMPFDPTCGEIAVEEITTSATITAYPNPTNGTIYVSSIDEISSYALIDLTGRICEQSQISTKGTLSLDVSTYSKGIYTLQVVTLNGRTATTKIVVY